MKSIPVSTPVLVLLLLCLLQGCANIVPPSGGKKDEIPPKLLSVTPPDSQLNIKVRKLELRFDEYVVVNDAAKEIQIAPILPIPPVVIVANKKVTVTLPDTLLMDSTTYRISFGKAIQDLHENNPFTGYHYLFSTGSYFDSLWLKGKVLNALTGLPDTGAFVLLYAASVSDTAVVREKPLYAVRADATGQFRIEGLPPRNFRIYALHDKNDNLRYDGEEERIAFTTTIVRPQEDSLLHEPLRTFRELVPPDTADTEDLPGTAGGKPSISGKNSRQDNKKENEPLTYQVPVDTSDLDKRTLDITKPLIVTSNLELAELNADRITLVYDSSGVEVSVNIALQIDTADRKTFKIITDWRQDAAYTLRLLKGFIRDSAGTEAMPSRYSFRTKYEDDYAKVQINVAAAYYGNKHILMVTNGPDTVHHSPVTDTVVRLSYLTEGSYSLRIIIDENENGQWDTGDLLDQVQPEWVIPHSEAVKVRSGWENIIDFTEPAPESPAEEQPAEGGDVQNE